MGRNGEAALSPTDLGLLAGGRWRALQSAYAMLWRRGRLIHDGRGRVDRAGSAPREAGAVERAVYNALLGFQGAREAANRARVAEALAAARRELDARGLRRPGYRRLVLPLVLLAGPAWLTARTGLPPVAAILLIVAGVAGAVWFALPRTARGERLLARLRKANPLPDGDDLAPEAVGMLVALHGNAALRRLLPDAARKAGLYEGGRWSREFRNDNPSSVGSWAESAATDLDAGRP